MQNNPSSKMKKRYPVESCKFAVMCRGHGRYTLALSRSISLAVCVTVYFWLIRSLVDPTSTSSIIVRGPLQFSRLLVQTV